MRNDMISRYCPSLKRFEVYLPNRGITEVFDLENDPRIDFLWGQRDFILRSTNEVLLHFDKVIHESRVTSLGHGFWILSVSYDSSRVGKDQQLVTTEVLFHRERGKYEQRVAEDDAHILWGYRFLNCGLISCGNVFYDSISFKKVFELPAWIGWHEDFDENTKLAEFKIKNSVLIKLVKGKVHYIVDVTGTSFHDWPTFKEMRHDTPFLYPKGIDDNGVKVVPWEDCFFPTISNQYVVGWKHIVLEQDFGDDRDLCVVMNRLGEKICGCQHFDIRESGGRRYLDRYLRAYNEFFYVFASATYFVYNIYGDLIFNGKCYNLKLQDNLTFIVQFDYYGPSFLYNHRGECITPEGYTCLKDFHYERAFFVKDGKWGLLQYIFNDKVVELYVDGDNTYIECDYQNENPIVGTDGPYIEWRGVFYNMDLKEIEKKPCPEIAYGGDYGVGYGIYINGERVEMDDDIWVMKSLGNGFFLGEYDQIGHFDTTGKIVDLTEKKKLPIVYPENAPQYYETYQRKRLDRGIAARRILW